MKMFHLTKQPLSPRAEELVQFDMDSIRQVVGAKRGEPPELWLADPGQYEHNGRVLRDSTSPRLLAYSTGSLVLYVTDGCNSCSHALEAELSDLQEGQLEVLASKTGIRIELLRELSAHC